MWSPNSRQINVLLSWHCRTSGNSSPAYSMWTGFLQSLNTKSPGPLTDFKTLTIRAGPTALKTIAYRKDSVHSEPSILNLPFLGIERHISKWNQNTYFQLNQVVPSLTLPGRSSCVWDPHSCSHCSHSTSQMDNNSAVCVYVFFITQKQV